MNKAFLFVIMLVSVSFVGCIEDSSEELSSEDTTSENTQEDEGIITPVGVDNATNMAPYVTAGVWLSNDDYVIFDPFDDDEARLGIYVNWAAKDFDGSIANAGFDLDLDMNIDVFVEEDFGLLISNTSAQNETLELQNSNWKYDFVTNRDVCGLIFHTTFAFIAVDNEGATGIQLVQYVFQDRIDYDDMMDIKDNFPGLLGITDDMEELPYLDYEDRQRQRQENRNRDLARETFKEINTSNKVETGNQEYISNTVGNDMSKYTKKVEEEDEDLPF